jgi:hypothetical protein
MSITFDLENIVIDLLKDYITDFDAAHMSLYFSPHFVKLVVVFVV